jgi:CBS domain-containing protein
MRGYSVGNVVVKHVIIRVIAQAKDPRKTLKGVGDVMSAPIITISAGVGDGIRLMRGRGIRRLPVIDDNGELAGIVSLADLINLLADELAASIKYEQEK